MLILTIRSHKPEAEIGLYDDDRQLEYIEWQAHRELAETIHIKIRDLLNSHDTTLDELQGIVVYKGPGSFTGLRIGIAVANALAGALIIPVVSTQTDDWIKLGIGRLVGGENEKIVTPEYGAPVHITKAKK